MNLSQNPSVASQIRLDSCEERINRTTAILFCAVVIVVYILLNSMRELIQIYQQKLHYILETVNLISWVLYISALVMVTPAFQPDGGINTIHYSAASIAVFLSWFRLLLFLQRFDQVGIYVVMFLEILQTLIKVLMVFSILIIAFGLAFYILLSKVGSFIWIFRVIVSYFFLRLLTPNRTTCPSPTYPCPCCELSQ